MIINLGTKEDFLFHFGFALIWKFLLQILKRLSGLVHSFDKIHHTSLIYNRVKDIFFGCTNGSFRMFFCPVRNYSVWAILLQNSDDLLHDCPIHLKSFLSMMTTEITNLKHMDT